MIHLNKYDIHITEFEELFKILDHSTALMFPGDPVIDFIKDELKITEKTRLNKLLYSTTVCKTYITLQDMHSNFAPDADESDNCLVYDAHGATCVWYFFSHNVKVKLFSIYNEYEYDIGAISTFQKFINIVGESISRAQKMENEE